MDLDLIVVRSVSSNFVFLKDPFHINTWYFLKTRLGLAICMSRLKEGK